MISSFKWEKLENLQSKLISIFSVQTLENRKWYVLYNPAVFHRYNNNNNDNSNKYHCKNKYRGDTCWGLSLNEENNLLFHKSAPLFNNSSSAVTPDEKPLLQLSLGTINHFIKASLWLDLVKSWLCHWTHLMWKCCSLCKKPIQWCERLTEILQLLTLLLLCRCHGAHDTNQTLPGSRHLP